MQHEDYICDYVVPWSLTFIFSNVLVSGNQVESSERKA